MSKVNQRNLTKGMTNSQTTKDIGRRTNIYTTKLSKCNDATGRIQENHTKIQNTKIGNCKKMLKIGQKQKSQKYQKRAKISLLMQNSLKLRSQSYWLQNQHPPNKLSETRCVQSERPWYHDHRLLSQARTFTAPCPLCLKTRSK